MKGLIVILLGCVLSMPTAFAHGVSESDKEAMVGGGTLDYIWLGAEHMLTGYDHLLFLFGVLFFLAGFRDVLRFITAFTLGHCITLLGATLAGVSANAYLIDAVIAVSVIYKGFENVDGFQRFLGRKAPNLLAMVFVFGLIHGFGLSTRLQELPLGDEGLIVRILSFNVGVEMGQVAALCVMLVFFNVLRRSSMFSTFSNVANMGLMFAGFGLFVFQVSSYFAEPSVHGPEAHSLEEHHDAHEAEEHHEHGTHDHHH